MKKLFIFIMVFISIFSESPSKGKKIKKREFFYQDYISTEDKFGELFELWSCVYDLEGQPLEERRVYDGSVDEKIKYKFDKDNKLVELNVTTSLEEGKKVVYEYEEDILIGKKVYKNNVLVSEDKNIYNEDGYLVYIEGNKGLIVEYVYNKDGKVMMESDGVVKNYYFYDDNGNLEKDRCEIDDTVVYCKEYEYDNSGKLIKMKEETFSEVGNNRKNTREIHYKYNDKGHMVEEKWKESNSEVWNKKRMENTYNANNDLVEIKEYEAISDKKEILIREYKYEYEYY